MILAGMDASKLAIIAVGFAAGVILALRLTAAPTGQLAIVPIMPTLTPPGTASTSDTLPDGKQEHQTNGVVQQRVAELRVKRDVRRALKDPRSARFGKLYQGNGASGRFSICGEVTNARNVATSFLYLADTGEVVLFTNPTNNRVTPETYNIFMTDCRDAG